MKTIAIFGAGPALGRAVARRFGREGFEVALVARNRDRLEAMVDELGGEGVQAAAFPADLGDRASALSAVDAIQDRYGSIDVLEYSPGGDGLVRTPPSQVDVAAVAPLLDKFVLTPVALVGRVLPAMLERGDGALLFALGAAARYPTPRVAGTGIALAALRNYVHTLHAELGADGIYAGALLIGSVIEGSQAHRAGSQWRAGAVVTAESLADRYWDMYLKRDRIDEEVIARPVA